VTATDTTTDPSTPDAGPSGLRRALLWTGVLALVLLAAYAALVAATGDGLPRGAKVLGVEVGGLSPAQAQAKLEAELGPQAEAGVDVTIDGQTATLVPADSGLSFDAAATVEGLGGRVWNPVLLVEQLTGSVDIAPVVGVDQGALAEAVKQLAADSDTAVVEPAIEIRGTQPVLVPGKDGRAIDQPAAVEAISAAYLVTSEPVELPVQTTSPSVDQASADAALAQATTALSGPVGVKVGDITTAVPVAALARALSFAPEGGKLVPTLDGAVLRDSIAEDIASVESPGRDATWKIVSGKPVVVPSKVGRGVNPDDLATAVATAMVVADPAQRTVTPTLGTIEPKLTTEQAKALNVVERIGGFTQKFPYAAYRFQNIGQAAKYMNGTLLKPGETFSLNKIIKERTVANGYTVGFVVGPGGVFREDQGGGVSASATTAWSAAFYSGLERVYTQAHSIWIPRYRAGLEATVAWGSFDMKFRNDTPNGVFITTIMKPTSLTITMWGTKVYDDIQAVSSPRRNVVPFKTIYSQASDCNAQTGQPGFTIDVFRVFIKDGKEVKREKITTRYRPAPTVICGPDPADKPTKSPSPTSTTTKPPASTSPKPTKTPTPTAT
jgi:vancomycin resistance protein YoaR